MVFRFRAVAEADLPMLAHWLEQPHVHRWWHHETTPEALERDFGPVLRGEEPAEDLVAELDGRPVGLCQRCRWHDYPDDVEEMAPSYAVPDDAVSIDYLVGGLADTGHGLGPRMIEALVADTWRRYPDCRTIVVPVAAGNRPSWRALEKARFTLVGRADLTPDNPADPPDHVVMRRDRLD